MGFGVWGFKNICYGTDRWRSRSRGLSTGVNWKSVATLFMIFFKSLPNVGKFVCGRRQPARSPHPDFPASAGQDRRKIRPPSSLWRPRDRRKSSPNLGPTAPGIRLNMSCTPIVLYREIYHRGNDTRRGMASVLQRWSSCLFSGDNPGAFV